MKRTGPTPRREIDLRLAVAEALLPGQPATWSQTELAAYLGCHHRLIQLIEQEAFRKLRRALLAYPEIADVFACPLQKRPSVSSQIRITHLKQCTRSTP